MKFSNLLWGAGALCAVVAVPCAAQTMYHEKVVQTITVNAAPAKVWAQLNDFEGVARWNNSVERSMGIDEDKEKINRLVVYKDGVGKEVDVLDDSSDANMTQRYHVKSSPWPVSNFNVVLKVSSGPSPGTSVVEWRASYDSAGTAIDPDGPPPVTTPSRGPIVYGYDVETYDTSRASGDTPVKRDTRTLKILSDLAKAGLDSLKWVVER
ncbi:MAG: SRPBCC family protein [Betaproteobacteria bacterium]|nr:SRPBCC family protein [Betaproteobacteria bacterium]